MKGKKSDAVAYAAAAWFEVLLNCNILRAVVRKDVFAYSFCFLSAFSHWYAFNPKLRLKFGIIRQAEGLHC